jgi:hypothetical protein
LNRQDAKVAEEEEERKDREPESHFPLFFIEILNSLLLLFSLYFLLCDLGVLAVQFFNSMVPEPPGRD